MEAFAVDKFNNINCWYYALFSYKYLFGNLSALLSFGQNTKFIFKINSSEFIVIPSDMRVWFLLLLSDRISCKIVQLGGRYCTNNICLQFDWTYVFNGSLVCESIYQSAVKKREKNCGLVLRFGLYYLFIVFMKVLA